MSYHKQSYRHISLLMLLALTLANALAACGAPDAEGTVGTAATQAAPTVSSLATQVSNAVGNVTDTEGVVVYYSTRPEEGLPPLEAAFERDNPGIDLQIIRGSSSDIAARLLTEARASQQQADVVEINSLPMAELDAAGILGQLPASVLDTLPAAAKGDKGQYAGTRYFGHVIPYNTKLVPADKAPKDHKSFLDPYWKDQKFIVGANDIEWAYQVIESMGEEAGKKFLQDIAAQNPTVRDEGRGAIAELVATGEVPAAVMTLSYHVPRRQAKGLPIGGAEWKPPLVNIDWYATFAKAPHPKAAQVFTEWLFGEKGRATDVELEFARIGDEGTEAALAGNPLILSPKTADVQRRASDIFEEIFAIK